MRLIIIVILGLILAGSGNTYIRAQEKTTTVKQISKQDIDLDADGQNDLISFACYSENDAFGYDTYVLSVNTQMITGHGANIDGNFQIVDIDSTDRYREIGIPEAGPSDDYRTHFYYYTGESLEYMGTIPDGGTPGTSKLYTDGSSIVHTWKRGNVLHTWFYPAEYRLDESHRLVFVPKDFYIMNYPAVMKSELALQELPMDSSIITVLKAGEKVTILGSDDEKWCLVETEDGRRGWFAVERFSTIVGTGKWATEVFGGLNMAD